MTDYSQKPARRITRAEWEEEGRDWKGLVAGDMLDSAITILFYATDEVGTGPRWHVHPYDEVFILRMGRARFTIGSDTIDAEEGDVLMGPAGVPHKYENLGPGRLETTDIHLSPRWIQTDLDDPETPREAP